MPVPTILRRAVPPRRKVVNAPSPASESSSDVADASDAVDGIDESRHLDAKDSASPAVTDDKAPEEHSAHEPDGISDEVISVVAEAPEDASGCIEHEQQETPIVSAVGEVTSESGVDSDSAVLAELAS
jgi:hypothetical protein